MVLEHGCGAWRWHADEQNSIRRVFLLSTVFLFCPFARPALAQVDERANLELPCDAGSIRASGLVDPGAMDDDAWRALEVFAKWHMAVTGLEVGVEHDPGALVLRLEGKDRAQVEAAKRLVERGLSICHFYLVAEDRDVDGGLAVERERFEAWRAKDPTRPWLEYNADPGRREPGIAWFPTRWAEKTGAPMAVRIPREESQEFSGVDFARVYRTTDSIGSPAVGFELEAERIEDFANFTEQGVGRRFAIVLRGEVRAAPTLNGRLVGGGIIEGRFTDKEVGELVTVLRQAGAVFDHPPLFTPSLVLRLILSAVVLSVAGAVLWRALRKRSSSPDGGEADADAPSGRD